MSARFSTSPTLRLPIARSRICALWQGAFTATLFTACILLVLRGYPWLALGLGAVLAWQLPALFRQPMVGTVVRWQRGRWLVERKGEVVEVSLHPSCRVSPLGVHLCWRGEKGVRESVWLFPDSGPAQQLRRLRVRLTLER